MMRVCYFCSFWAEVLFLLNSQSRMPSESIKRLLAKKRAGGEASAPVSTVGAGEKDPVDISAGGDAIGAVAVSSELGKEMKDELNVKERKRHRKHGSSRTHHHKKHRGSGKCVIIDDSDKVSVELSLNKSSCAGGGFEAPERVNIDKGKSPMEEIGEERVIAASEVSRYGALDVCRAYAKKLLVELNKVKDSEFFAEMSEVERLRGEVNALKNAKKSLGIQLSEITRVQETASSKISSLLTENASLSGECSALSLMVKNKVLSISEARG
ncbi:uncharacterized protein LOC141676539 [Apium graveolens]|uniref:uncharacterized protein LOC141676539 n=1 Tax=Apium graveolens TaxID=4045 RepID=UPI003D7B1A6A